jgi:DNA-binding transcriptional regulator/RsmH inhibitor MraZ
MTKDLDYRQSRKNQLAEAAAVAVAIIHVGGDAVIVGSRDHAEIWAPERWDDYRRALDDPQELARAFEGLGI